MVEWGMSNGVNFSNLDKYNLCLLDTNFISTIVKSQLNKSSDIRITRELLKQHIKPANNIICVSPTTIKELRRNDQIYSEFKIFFEIFPFCILYSFDEIINLEKTSNNITKEDLILTSISRFKNYNLSDVLDNEKVIKILEQTREWDKLIAKDEIGFYRQSKFITKDKLLKDSINRIAHQYGIEVECITSERYPARLLFIHNQIFQFKNSNTYDEKIAISNANDRIICAATPYMDKVFIENRQAEFLNQMKKQGILNQKIEIYTMRDIK